MRLYGIPNCDTVKKARAWLDARGVAYVFVDFKKTAPSPALLEQWVGEVGWEHLLNRRGTTWRQLPDAVRDGVNDAASAIAVMHAHPSVIKRPVVESARRVLVGFDEGAFGALPEAAGARQHG